MPLPLIAVVGIAAFSVIVLLLLLFSAAGVLSLITLLVQAGIGIFKIPWYGYIIIGILLFYIIRMVKK